MHYVSSSIPKFKGLGVYQGIHIKIGLIGEKKMKESNLKLTQNLITKVQAKTVTLMELFGTHCLLLK
jgi:hypothetical protein